jgi:hypothetical protein
MSDQNPRPFLKVRSFVKIVEKSLENGFSVVVLTHRHKTQTFLADKLKTDCLVSSRQSEAENNQSIENFRNMNCRIIIFDQQTTRLPDLWTISQSQGGPIYTQPNYYRIYPTDEE